MSEKAIETNDSFTIEEDETEEITEDVVEAVETEAAESDAPPVEASAEDEEEAAELDIVVEGEEEPSSKPARKSRFAKRVDKLNGKVEAADGRADALQLENESLKEQNKLLRMKETVERAPTRPKASDYDTDESFEAALDEYADARSREVAAGLLRETLAESDTQTTQQKVEAQQRSDIEAHYERADTLKVKNYTDVEDNAIGILGDDATKAIMANTDLSHVLLYHLGLEKNAGKAEEFAALLKRNPVKGLLEIGGYANKLVVKPKHSNAPDPESRIDPGSAAGGTQVAGVTYS